jgi:tetratricopeptide (TPR) repeat protein
MRLIVRSVLLSLAVLAMPAGLQSAEAQRSVDAQREWDKTWQAIGTLTLEDKTAEAIAIVKAFLARYPDVADAHFIQASFYERLAGFSMMPTPEERRHLENAVTHYRRAADLMTDADARFVTLWKLVHLHGPDRLNQPADAERFAKRMVQEHPAKPESHVVYAQLLRARNDIAGAADVVRKGRAQAPDMPIVGQMLLVQYLLEQVTTSREFPRDATRKALDEAITVADALIADPRKEGTEYRLATMAKAMALELMAERVERDRQRKIALLVESERWGAPIDQHVNGAPPAARTLTTDQAAELEWDSLSRWNARLMDDGRFAEAAAAYTAYLTRRPTFSPAHTELAELDVRWAAEAATDAKARIIRLEDAIAHLQRAIDLAPDDDARDIVFTRLLEVLGPGLLNRPDREEAAARAMLVRHPAGARAHAALAHVLLRTGRAADADGALRAARAAVPATASSRAALAGRLLAIVRTDEALPAPAARRLFDEADVLSAEAEKLGPDNPDALAVRGGWFLVNADRYERDPARARELAERGQRLLQRSIELRQKK